MKVKKRDGIQIVPFDASKIADAIKKAFDYVGGISVDEASKIAGHIAADIAKDYEKSLEENINIEDIQTHVEKSLMRIGQYDAVRRYITYRDKKTGLRSQLDGKTYIVNGESKPFTTKVFSQFENLIVDACDLYACNPSPIISDFLKNLVSGLHERDIIVSLIMSTRTLTESDPNYSRVTAKLLLTSLEKEVSELVTLNDDYFRSYVEYGINSNLLDPKLNSSFDLEKLNAALKPERDLLFDYLGLQILYDRYLLQSGGNRIELPQAFFMRVAMGLALNEDNREDRAIEFYNTLSQFDLMCSTPTLFNSGTLRPQLSSCYISTVPDSAEGIMKTVTDNALLSKYAGGIGNDWTQIRGRGAHIKGTDGTSQGVIPFMKIAESGLIAFNQSGKRRGSGCAYLSTWHIDIEEFLELRKNTGDHRRRTHDMSTANWIPDCFMQRVLDGGQWTLFSPDEVPDLNELYGTAFSERYAHYETMADKGEIKIFKRVNAVELWRKMLTMLFETGHPWICFKDPCNIRNPQQHVGMVRSSNLCTEIIENTSSYETAVCNLASINLANHITDGRIDEEKLARTVRIGMRMLDNVIDINFYPIPEARYSNMRHRPVGLGIMGFQDALYQLRIPFASYKAVEFSDKIMELISYNAISASSDLAQERGRYETFEGSLWSQGILPINSIELLAQQRGEYLTLDRSSTLDWDSLRERVKTTGMRNSNCMAIAPTATISNICGVTQSIEPTYQNLFVKTNLSGDFTVINRHLVDELKVLGLWNPSIVQALKTNDGSIQGILSIPEWIKTLFAQAFEIDPEWVIECAARRGKWIDQSQSINLYFKEPDGKRLNSIYTLAWISGIKTTYYLRSLGATHVAKNTIQQPCTDEVCEVCQ